jgi:2-polyprenyl-3-methyl-5-hydroxy-6-metoxy-1,4-benzoquinol methylase
MSENIKSMKDFYNTTANDWAEKWYSDETMLPLLKKFISLFSIKPRILDVGCGAGYESMRLSGLGARVVGIDVSEKSIDIAREKNPNCEFKIMDCRQLDKTLGKFDGIIAIALIVHIEDNDLKILFDNFYGIIDINGFLFIAFVEGDGLSEKRSNVEINGEKYNRAFFLHQSNRVIEIAKGTGFEYFDEWFLEEPIGQWKYIVFKKM